jgi:hypothetical protein
MWPNILTQLLEARFIALVALLFLAGWAALKRKALKAVSERVWRATTDWLWTSAEKKLAEHRAPDTTPPQRGRPPGSYEKTYRGIFQSYRQFEKEPRDYFFQLLEGETTVFVPVVMTSLFSPVRHGDAVEVETRVGVYHHLEIVLNVRIATEPATRRWEEVEP